MLCPSHRPRVCRPARSENSDIPLLGILVVFILLLCVAGGGFLLFTMRRAQMEQARAVEAEMHARLSAEMMRDEARAAQEAGDRRAKEGEGLKDAERQVMLLTLDRALDLCEKGQIDDGLLWLARGLEGTRHKDWQQVFALNILLWSQPTASPRLLAQRSAPVTALAVSADRKTVLCGTEKGTVDFLNLETGKPIGESVPLDGPIRAVAFHPQGASIGAAIQEGRWFLIDAALRKPSGDPENLPGPVFAFHFRPDGSPSAIGSCNRGMWVRDGVETNEIGARAKTAPIVAAALAADGKRCLSGHEDGQVFLWALPEGKSSETPLQCEPPLRALELSPDGKLLVAAADKGIRLWDLATRRPVGPLLRPANDVRSLGFVADSRGLLVGHRDGAVRLWTFPSTEGIAPERLILSVQVKVGAELDANGVRKSLDPSVKEERRQRLDKVGGPLRP